MTTAAEVSAVHPQTVGHRLGGLGHAPGDMLDDVSARLATSLQVGDDTADRR